MLFALLRWPLKISWRALVKAFNWSRGPKTKIGQDYVHHTLVVGGSRSGKTTGTIKAAVERARKNDCAIIYQDPSRHGGQEFFDHLVHENMAHRVVIYDDHDDYGLVPGYELTRASTA